MNNQNSPFCVFNDHCVQIGGYSCLKDPFLKNFSLIQGKGGCKIIVISNTLGKSEAPGICAEAPGKNLAETLLSSMIADLYIL